MQNTAFSIEGLFDFLNAGVSAFHSTAAAVKILEANGYRNCPEGSAWELAPGGKYYTVIRPPGGSRSWTAARTPSLPRPRPRATAA